MRFLLLAMLAFAAPEKTSTVPSKRPPDPEVGERLWAQSCWQCHGESGKGDGPASAAVPGGVPAMKEKVVDADFSAFIEVIEDGRGRMPAYAEVIDRHDARRILVYLRDKGEGKAPPPPPPVDEPEGDVKGEGQ